MLHLQIQVCEKKILFSKIRTDHLLYHLCIYTFRLCLCVTKVEVCTDTYICSQITLK